MDQLTEMQYKEACLVVADLREFLQKGGIPFFTIGW